MPKEDKVKEFFEAMTRLQNELEQVPAKGRNFKIEISEKESGCSIVLAGDYGRLFDLAAFLPEKFSFASGENFYCSWTREVVTFSKDLIPLRGFLLSLFHEIGHAHKKPSKIRTLDWPDRVRLWWDILKKLARKPHKIFRKTKADFSFLPWWFVDRFLYIEQARSERAAWVFSLNKLRWLKKQGLDVFCGFKSIRQIIIYVDYQLLTYELARFCRRVKTEGDVTLDKYKGIFYKKFILGND